MHRQWTDKPGLGSSPGTGVKGMAALVVRGLGPFLLALVQGTLNTCRYGRL